MILNFLKGLSKLNLYDPDIAPFVTKLVNEIRDETELNAGNIVNIIDLGTHTSFSPILKLVNETKKKFI